MLQTLSRTNNWIRQRATKTFKGTAAATSTTTSSIGTRNVITSSRSARGCYTKTDLLKIPAKRFRFSFAFFLPRRTMDSLPGSASGGGAQKEGGAAALPAEESASPKHTNRLALEKSPYLLQHAHNPVDWYPWCTEAIEKARKENKLIFLSVGYSTCHWCHVMAHESFEDEKTAELMNKLFVNIKIDREERPDIDKIYMQFVLMLNGHGGWPMSVWLTPDQLAPVAAGTYYPKVARFGMPSFCQVLQAIGSKWSEKSEEIKSKGGSIIGALKKSFKTGEAADTSDDEQGGAASQAPKEIRAEQLIRLNVRLFKRRYDPDYGGFGSHPKFPEVSQLNFLLHIWAVSKEQEVLEMVLHTLYCLGRGGIHDHIFGGFSRYSVDAKWHVPHFEKMLYDQGQLMDVYAQAYQISKNPFYLRCAERTFEYIQKDLQHPEGAYYAGEDADSFPSQDSKHKIEGAFYAWAKVEIEQVILANGKLFERFGFKDAQKVYEIYAHHYDIRSDGNVEPASDPQGHFLDKNIPIIRGSLSETAEKFEVPPQQLEELLDLINSILHDKRNLRPRPHLDTKILSSWNGLTLSGISKLANCYSSSREECLRAGQKLFKFIRQHLYDSERNVLTRSVYGQDLRDAKVYRSPEPIDGFCDDYAFIIKGLLDYFKASLDVEALNFAKELQDRQDALLWDTENGGYFYSVENASNAVIRIKDDHDGAEPCGNSISAQNLLLLHHYFQEDRYKAQALKVFDFFYRDTTNYGANLPALNSAFCQHELGLDTMAIVARTASSLQDCVDAIRQHYIPGLALLVINMEEPEKSLPRDRAMPQYKMLGDEHSITLYICSNGVCRLPIHDVGELQEYLKEQFVKRQE